MSGAVHLVQIGSPHTACGIRIVAHTRTTVQPERMSCSNCFNQRGYRPGPFLTDTDDTEGAG